MIEKEARVIALDGESAWVETARESVCGTCAANKGCGTGLFAKAMGAKVSRLRVVNRAGAAAGDDVVLGIDEQILVRGSLAAYAAPLLAMLACAIAADVFAGTESETVVIAAGAAGLVAGFAWVYRHAGRARLDPRYQPLVLRVLEEGRVPARASGGPAGCERQERL